jgi:addiction module HigA family antidote
MLKSSITIKTTDPPGRIATHPGVVLSEEFLKPLDLSAHALAMALGVPAMRIVAIVKGEHGVSADTAIRLGRFFGTSAEFWMHMQVMHDLTRVRQEHGAVIERDVRPRLEGG